MARTSCGTSSSSSRHSTAFSIHHERFDGRGYPLGLSGGDIPLFARIVAVADGFESLTRNADRAALPLTRRSGRGGAASRDPVRPGRRGRPAPWPGPRAVAAAHPRDVQGWQVAASGYDHDDPGQSDAMAERSWPQRSSAGLSMRWPAARRHRALLGLLGLVLTLSSLVVRCHRGLANGAADPPWYAPGRLRPGHRRRGVPPGRDAGQSGDRPDLGCGGLGAGHDHRRAQGSPAHLGVAMVVTLTAVAMAARLAPLIARGRDVRVSDIVGRLVSVAVAALLFRWLPVWHGKSVLTLQHGVAGATGLLSSWSRCRSLRSASRRGPGGGRAGGPRSRAPAAQPDRRGQGDIRADGGTEHHGRADRPGRAVPRRDRHPAVPVPPAADPVRRAPLRAGAGHLPADDPCPLAAHRDRWLHRARPCLAGRGAGHQDGP